MAGSRMKSLAEQLAELDNPAPRDFDPEEDAPPADANDDDSEVEAVDENAGREHYVSVGKSKLRKRDVVPLGPRYDGSKVSRDAIEGEDEEDDPFSKGFDEEESSEEDEELEAAGEQDSEAEGSEDSQDEDDDDEGSPATELSDEEEDDETADEDVDSGDEDTSPSDDRAELRKMMAEEQKAVAANLSQAAKADAEKGRAVKQQRLLFDSLLSTRIKLQKALIGANTLSGLSEQPSTDETNTETPTTTEAAFHAAETAAFTLWSSLNNLRETLESTRSTDSKKRKRSAFTPDTPIADLWSHMQTQEATSTPYRNTVLEKWSAKARGAAAVAPRNRLNTTGQQTIVDVLREQLNGGGEASERLVKRARTPRSCAPLQVQKKVSFAGNIYDDADFYGLLLQSLLEQRNADSVAASASTAANIDVSFQMRREAKTKKNVDTKASKGRKLRYTVHEKLQNYMAPEDRSTWVDRQADELFGSLLGRRMGLGEDEDDDENMDDAQDENLEEAGLMLFRS